MPGFLLRNNYQYTRVLCNWALSHEIRFVYASSAATYGDGAEGYDDADAVTPTLKPLNMYGYSKQMFDLWALKHRLFNPAPDRSHDTEGANIVGLKYFNVYGPYEDHKGDMRSVVSKSYEQIRGTGEVKLFKSYRPEYKDGEQMRDFIFVKDAVDVTLHFALQGADAPGGLFNCGTGKARTWVDLATAVFDAMGLAPKIEFIEMPEQLQGKYQYFTQANDAEAARGRIYEAVYQPGRRCARVYPGILPAARGVSFYPGALPEQGILTGLCKEQRRPR